LSVFIDSSVWFSAAVVRDHDNIRAKSILQSTRDHVTSDHVLVETWLLLNSRYRREVAERFWDELQRGGVHVEMVTAADLQAARAIGATFSDQTFSIVDRTSFAVMERIGIVEAASFDKDFAVYRYGPNREKAFNVIRSGHSATFSLFHQAILNRQQITCRYKSEYREFCPHILGHKGDKEVAQVYQFGGGSSRGLPPEGQFRCVYLKDIQDAKTRDGQWFGGDKHKQKQRCVDRIYIHIDLAVPNQPGRR
jgi:uncharacterized protein